MGDLVNMKRSADDRDAANEAAPSSMIDEPLYPWGLSINLDEDSLEKLDLELPKVGKKFTLVAAVEVTSVSSNASKGGESQSVGLQITDMCLEAPGAAATLYKE